MLDFQNKTFISATPYKFTDCRFNELEQIKVHTSHLNNKLNVVFSEDILATLKSVIIQFRGAQNNLHVFYNSVNGISRLLKMVGDVAGISVFCANTSENNQKLDVYGDLIREISAGYSKINFYTSKYFEGWDLEDEKATILLVTDVKVENTCINMLNKGVQAIGRLRTETSSVYHITNHQDSDNVVTETEIISSIHNLAKMQADTYNSLLEAFDFKAREGKEFFCAIKAVIENRVTFDPMTCKAVLDSTKVDSLINQRLTMRMYSNQSIVIDTWSKAGFTVMVLHDKSSKTAKDYAILSNARASKKDKNAVVFAQFHQYFTKTDAVKYNSDSTGLKIDFSGATEYHKLSENHPKLLQYYKVLGYDKVKELNYNDKKMECEYIIVTSTSMEVSENLKKLVYSMFESNKFYPSDKIKSKLIEIYDNLNLNTKRIKGSSIDRFFYVNGTTTKRINGVAKNGYQLGLKKI